MEKASRDPSYLIDGRQEQAFVGLRRLVEAANFSHKLQRSRSNLFVGNGRIEVEKRLDIPAHQHDLRITVEFEGRVVDVGTLPILRNLFGDFSSAEIQNARASANFAGE